MSPETNSRVWTSCAQVIPFSGAFEFSAASTMAVNNGNTTNMKIVETTHYSSLHLISLKHTAIAVPVGPWQRCRLSFRRCFPVVQSLFGQVKANLCGADTLGLVLFPLFERYSCFGSWSPDSSFVFFKPKLPFCTPRHTFQMENLQFRHHQNYNEGEAMPVRFSRMQSGTITAPTMATGMNIVLHMWFTERTQHTETRQNIDHVPVLAVTRAWASTSQISV